MNFVVSFENTTAHLILMKNKQASQGVFLKKVFSLSFLRCKHIAKKESNVLRSRSQKIRYPVIILLFTDKNLQANGKEHSIFFCFNFHAGIFKRLHSGLHLSTYFGFAYLFPASTFSVSSGVSLLTTCSSLSATHKQTWHLSLLQLTGFLLA